MSNQENWDSNYGNPNGTNNWFARSVTQSTNGGASGGAPPPVYIPQITHADYSWEPHSPLRSPPPYTLIPDPFHQGSPPPQYTSPSYPMGGAAQADPPDSPIYDPYSAEGRAAQQAALRSPPPFYWNRRPTAPSQDPGQRQNRIRSFSQTAACSPPRGGYGGAAIAGVQSRNYSLHENAPLSASLVFETRRDFVRPGSRNYQQLLTFPYEGNVFQFPPPGTTPAQTYERTPPPTYDEPSSQDDQSYW